MPLLGVISIPTVLRRIARYPNELLGEIYDSRLTPYSVMPVISRKPERRKVRAWQDLERTDDKQAEQHTGGQKASESNKLLVRSTSGTKFADEL
jgi:hypothetical protein